uniref:G_PROTEIN_RECEP_F1_2 domain-containing protein n=1 Tax=Steinernema glaseri TaxID=37863 RepID=A0A1I8AH76_9BILA
MTYGDYAAAISILIIAVPGLFGNLNIIAAIMRKRDLRTKSGCLMCLIAFYDSISIFFELITAKRLFCGEILLKRDCFQRVIPYFIILVTQSYTLLALAVDRLIAIFYPMREVAVVQVENTL